MTEDAVPEREIVRQKVREHYAEIAKGPGCCGTSADVCCAEGAGGQGSLYLQEELETLPAGADLGLGCGNPTALLSLAPGETVLDLGSGAGIDCFLASRQVGPRGRVIGVDMTPEMIARARHNARRGGYPNVEFRQGFIEHLPVADGTVDVVLSNCVVNLAPDKGAVYAEAFRVLRPGGRLAISDMVATRPIRPEDRANAELWSACTSGALTAAEVEEKLRAAGFTGIEVHRRGDAELPVLRDGTGSLGVVPADIRAVKP